MDLSDTVLLKMDSYPIHNANKKHSVFGSKFRRIDSEKAENFSW